MESKLLKLKNKLDNYPVFQENQVLTEDHLNLVVNYLDQQTRRSRRDLVGFGVVCGLKLSVENRLLTLSKGCGLTTDGDLLEWPEDTSFPNFRLFKDENAKYPLFQNTSVYELIPEGTEELQQMGFSQFSKQTERKLTDFAAVLYLESYLFDPDICAGDNCDNKGETQTNKLRVLLISKNVASKQTSLLSAGKSFFNLNKLAVQRLVLVPGAIDSYSKLANSYQTIINQASQAVQNALKKTYTQLSFLLGSEYNHVDPTPAWNSKLSQITSSTSTSGKQYVFSFVKDVVQAYNEFLDCCYQLNVECLPVIDLSPKHLFIGDAAVQIEDKKDPFHQSFVESPVLNHQDEQLRRCRFLFNRIGVLINSTDFSNPKTIRITPSLGNAKLGSKAIPVYYKPEGEGQLVASWDFDKTEKDRQLGIYSYHATEYTQQAEALNPLSYDLTAFDHFRIEGHLGQNFQSVYETLKGMIRNNNLPFQVLPIMIENDLLHAWVWPGLKYYGMEIVHKLYRDELINNLNELKKFNVELNTKVQAADDSELPPLDIEANNLSLKAFTSQQTNLVNQKINATKTFLAKSVVDFDYNSFESNYKEIVSNGAVLNKGIKGVTFASAYTPLEKTVNNINFSKLKNLSDLLKKREDKNKEKSMLQTFAEQHPGLEHTGGVPKGGTFILLYSSSSKNVVADMSLPYWYVDVPTQDVPENSNVDDDNLVLDWKFNNDLFVYVNQNKKLKDNITSLGSQLEVLKFDLNSQKTNLNSYQGSINTLIQTIPNYKLELGNVGLPTTNIQDVELAKNAGIMQEMSNYKTYLESKVGAGTATESEKSIYNNMDAVMAGVVEDTIQKTAKASGDITKSGDAAATLEMAVNMTKTMKDTKAIESVRKSVDAAKSASSSKANYLASLNLFQL